MSVSTLARSANPTTPTTAPATQAAERTAASGSSPPAPTSASTSTQGLNTRALHAGRGPCPTTGALVPPIVQSTTFAQREVGKPAQYAYSRVSNPTVTALEEALGALEDAPPAAAFGTGLSSVATLILATCKAGDHVICSQVIYGGTVRLLQRVLAPLGITASFVDTRTPGPVAAALTPNTKLVILETPGNPTLTLADVPGIARLTRAAGVTLAVDNTFLTAALFRPLDFGADVSIYSTTKHIEGHNAAVGGAIVTRDQALLDQCRFLRKAIGTIQAPFDAWLTLRGLRTLPLRIAQHSRNAQLVAEFLAEHPAVAHVNYPGLPSFPQAALAADLHRSSKGEALHGGVLSLELHGGFEAGKRLLEGVRLCALAEHVGSIDTIVTHSASMTHADVPRDQRLAAGITDGLVRISVGLEDPADVIADLRQALDAIVTN
ncbi:MAG: trans-sulfuration enzyme family protein [bacterium]|jgi:cystathionine beta-lyase/cystathionine gamma-synthase